MSRSQIRLVDNDSLHDFEYPPLPGASTKEPDEKLQGQMPTPYLQLLARLSQAWLNQWTVLILLVVFRLFLVKRHLRQDLSNGQSDLNSACKEVQTAASLAVSMPHYMAVGTNALIKKGIDAAVAGMSLIVMGLITAFEEIFLYFINTFKSTYLCLLEFAVGGAIDVVLDTIEVVGNFVNETLKGLSDDITAGVKDVNTAIDSVEDILVKAAKFLGEDITIPTISIPQVSELQNLSIPDTFDTELQTLKTSLNLSAIQTATDQALRYPFEDLKALVNQSLSGYSFNESLLIVPAKEQLTFCAERGLNNTFDVFQRAVYTSYNALLVVLVIAAILAMVPHIWLEWKRWRALVLGSSVEARALRQTRPVDAIDLNNIVSHPLQSLVGIKVADQFEDQRSKNLARWLVAYISHEPAALVLLLGITGLLACALQGILLYSIAKAAPTVTDNISDVSVMVAQSMQKASTTWANQTNVEILIKQTELNHDLFGWVDTSTTAVNNTLNVITDALISTLNETFGGTVLYTPILDVLDCILLVKIAGIEKGLTWVHDQAHITLPTVSVDTFAVKQSETGSMFDDIGSTTKEQVQRVIKEIVKLWKASIKQEAIVSTLLLCAWLLIALAGLIRVLLVSRSNSGSVAPFSSSCFVDDIKACISRPRPQRNTIVADPPSDEEKDDFVEEPIDEVHDKHATPLSYIGSDVTVVERYGDVGHMTNFSRPKHMIHSMQAVILK